MKQFSRRDSLPAPGHEGAAFSNLTTALVAVISLLFSTGALVALPGESTELGEYSQIAIGDTIKGVLEPIDGRLSSGQIVDRFTFEATEGQELLISLASYDFDPFLWLLNAKGNVLTIDDDSGDALGAVISDFTVPETGMYTVRVSSYSDSETGEYVFTLSEIPLIDNPFSISIGQGINGELSLNDPQFSSGQLYDVYSFEASPDRPVFISMISDSLDPNLWLFTKEGRVLSA
ncbi:MAG: hypothetical protein GY835_19400, partial [bacterium]|nr:hypothetical protein [bacterium]